MNENDGFDYEKLKGGGKIPQIPKDILEGLKNSEEIKGAISMDPYVKREKGEEIIGGQGYFEKEQKE